MTCKCCGAEIPSKEIMSEAARIRVAMRKDRSGPKKLHPCPRCGEEFLGYAMLNAHLTLCVAPPPVAIGPEDLVPWEPPT
jgi:hypothetical protein